jgi:hypothetical protein
MPVPESSYSRRYGREDSAFSSTSSYSRSASSALGGGRSYSSYSKLSSSTLPPRPPAYEYRKYSTTTTDTPSRFLSSSASRVGGGYRSSVSPVRATASSIRRQLEASAPSIAERIKQMELGEANDETTAPSSARLSRFSSRSRDSQKSGSSYVPSSYSTRERSASRDFSATTSSLKSTGSGSRASPPGGGGGVSRTRSGSGSVRNGLSRRLSSIEVTSESTESDVKAFATTTNTSPTTKLDLDNCHSSFPSNLNSPDLEVKVVNSASTNSASGCVMGVVSSGSVVVGERKEEEEEEEEDKDSNGNPIAPPPSLQSGSGIRLLEGVVGDKCRDDTSSSFPSSHLTPSITKYESDSNANDLREKSSRKLCNGEASKTERKKTCPKVIYHTIQVEDPPSCSPSPEPVYTLTARPSLDGIGPSIIQLKNVTKKKATPSSTESVSADFKVTLPKVKMPPQEDKEVVVPDNKPLNNGGTYEKELQENGETSEDQDPPFKKKEPSPPPAVTAPITNGTTEKREKSRSKSRETTPVSKVKVSNGEVENINNSCSTDNAMGPHSSKYYHITSNGGFQKDSSLPNRNERFNGRHHTTTSDSSDNVSYKSLPLEKATPLHPSQSLPLLTHVSVCLSVCLCMNKWLL